MPDSNNIEVVYTDQSPLSSPGDLLFEIATDIVRFRELVWILFLRDLKAQFRQSFLGYVWLFLPPMMTTGVWLFLNGQKVISVQNTSLPYPLFVMTGSVLWQTFVKLIQCPLEAFREGKPVFMKLKVPPEAFIAAGTARAVFEFLVYAIVLVPVFIYFQISPSWNYLYLPIYLIAIFAFGTALGLLLIPASSLYSDVAQAVPIVMSFLMYMTPVVFPVPSDGIASKVLKINPMTPLINGVRDIFTSGSLDCLLPACLVMSISLITATAAIIALRIVMPHLVARMGM